MHRNPVKRGLAGSPEEIHSVILSEAKDLCSWLSTEVAQLLFPSLGRSWTRARECRLD